MDENFLSYVDDQGVYQGPKHWKGFLDLRGCTSLVSLGELKTVNGWLDLEGCTSLVSLGKLETASYWLDLRGCTSLASLGELETVNDSLYINEVEYKDLKEAIKLWNHMSNLNLEELPRYLTSKGIEGHVAKIRLQEG